MDMQKRALLNVVKSSLTNEKTDLSACKLDYDFLVEYSLRHHAIVMLYYGLYNCDVKADNINPDIFNKVMNEIYIDTRQQQQISEIRRLFTNNKIDFIILKGGVLKNLYFKSEMRRMGDIDILIKTNQYSKISNIMKQMGYTLQGETDHELKWTKSGILIELHKKLIPSYNKDFYSYYGDGWKFAKHKTGNEYVLKKEDMFIYLFTHFAKHYRDAGIGIIHMCDLWVYMTSFQLDYTYIKNELKKLKLYEFYKNVKDTLSVWFENKEDTEMTDYITDVILNSGIYGTHDNHVFSAALKNRNKYKNTTKEKLHRILKTIFPPFTTMRNRHRVLFKLPFLLPICWVLRWFDLIFKKRDRIKNKMDDFTILNDNNMADYHSQLKYVGLDYHF